MPFNGFLMLSGATLLTKYMVTAVMATIVKYFLTSALIAFFPVLISEIEPFRLSNNHTLTKKLLSYKPPLSCNFLNTFRIQSHQDNKKGR